MRMHSAASQPVLTSILASCAESDHEQAQRATQHQVEAEEEVRLAMLTSQAGMKLTLTPKVPAVCVWFCFHVLYA